MEDCRPRYDEVGPELAEYFSKKGELLEAPFFGLLFPSVMRENLLAKVRISFLSAPEFRAIMVTPSLSVFLD